MSDIIITRQIDFCSSHRLHAKSLSDDENKELFGPCNNPNGHGHNYTLTVALKGPVDPVTGMLFNLKALNDILQETVMHEFDHRHLNEDTAHFSERVPTAENIAIVVWELLKRTDIKDILYYVNLQETRANAVRYYGGSNN